MKQKRIVTLADARAERIREDARQQYREHRMRVQAAQMKLAAANRKYEEFGGAIRRQMRMKAARELRELEARY